MARLGHQRRGSLARGCGRGVVGGFELLLRCGECAGDGLAPGLTLRGFLLCGGECASGGFELRPRLGEPLFEFREREIRRHLGGGADRGRREIGPVDFEGGRCAIDLLLTLRDGGQVLGVLGDRRGRGREGLCGLCPDVRVCDGGVGLEPLTKFGDLFERDRGGCGRRRLRGGLGPVSGRLRGGGGGVGCGAVGWPVGWAAAGHAAARSSRASDATRVGRAR